MNDFLQNRADPNPLLAALVATQPGLLENARPSQVLWLSDPSRTLHRALGLGRTNWLVFFQPKVLLGYLGAMWRGSLPKKSAEGEDLLQLGGDFLWNREGNLVWEHRSKDPADRPTLETIANVLNDQFG